MRSGGNHFWLAVAAALLVVAVGDNHAQNIPVKHATGFNSDIYYDAPNDDKVKMRLSGAEAAPLTGGLLDVKELQVTVFNTNGVTQLVAESPRCTYRVLDQVVDSPGHIEMASGDGKVHVSGDGYMIVLKENAFSLTLSNHVRTIIQTELLKP
jgi:hypothetical protein